MKKSYIVVIVLLIFIAGYVFIKLEIPQQQAEFNTKDTIDTSIFEKDTGVVSEIDNRQTFKGNYSNIEFKYPSDWSLQSENDGGFFTYAELRSPDLKIIKEYRGGDFPELIGWEGGARFNLKMWDLTKLNPEVKADLEKCLDGNTYTTVWIGIDGSFRECLPEGIKPQDLYRILKIDGAEIITVSGEKALIYALHRESFNFSDVYIRMLNKNDNNLLIDVKFSAFTPEKDIHFDTFADIVSTLKF